MPCAMLARTGNFEYPCLDDLDKDIRNYQSAQAWRTAFRMSMDNSYRACEWFMSPSSTLVWRAHPDAKTAIEKHRQRWGRLDRQYIQAVRGKRLLSVSSGTSNTGATLVSVQWDTEDVCPETLGGKDLDGKGLEDVCPKILVGKDLEGKGLEDVCPKILVGEELEAKVLDKARSESTCP